MQPGRPAAHSPRSAQTTHNQSTLNHNTTTTHPPQHIHHKTNAGVKAKREKLFGFGHRVYKSFDPRAAVIRRVAEEVFAIAGRDPLIEVAVALQDHALKDEYFVSRRLYPNVDFYSGLVYRAMGFPPQFFTVLFAVPR